MSSRLLHVLGPIAVTDDGARRIVTRPQSRLILALLAAAPAQRVSVDKLIDELWPDGGGDRKTLQVAINRTRDSLGAWGREALTHDADGYRIERGVLDVDSARWAEHAARGQAALNTRAWGEAADTFTLATEHWQGTPFANVADSPTVDLARAGLELAHVDVRRGLIEALTVVDPRRAAHGAAALVELDPLREDLVVAAMRAYCAVGRYGEALHLAGALRTALRTAHGLSPTAALADAEHAALAPADGPAGERQAFFDDQEAPPETAASARARVAQLIDARPAGSCGVFVVGERVPGAAADLPRLLYEATPPDVRATHLSSRRGSAISLQGVVAELLQRADTGTAHPQQLANDLARAPASWRLFISDGDRLDAWSRDLLVALVSAALPARRAVVATCAARPDGPLWAATPSARRLVVTAAPDVDRTGIDTGQQQRAEVAEDRDDTSDTTLAALHTLGPTIDVGVAAEVLGTSVVELLGRLSTALARNELGLTDDGAELTVLTAPPDHPARTTAIQRWQWLATASDVSADRGDAVDAATYALRAGPLVDQQTVMQRCLAAVDAAESAGMLATAAQFAGEAARREDDEPTRWDLVIRQARLLESAGRPHDASELFDRAADAALGLRRPDLLVAAATGGRGHAGAPGGDLDRLRRLRLALDHIGDHPRRPELCADAALETAACRQVLTERERRELVSYVDRADVAGRLLVQRWAVVDDELNFGTSLERGNQLGELALDPGEDTHARIAGLVVAAYVAVVTGSLTDADRWAVACETTGRAARAPRAEWTGLCYRAAIAEMRERLDESDALASEAVGVGHRLGIPDAEAMYGLHRMARALRSGAFGGYAATLSNSFDRYKFPVWGMMRAAAEAEAGNDHVARRLLGEFIDRAIDDADSFRVAAQCLAARAGALIGDEPALRRLDEVLRGRAGRFVTLGYGGPCLGPVDWYRAQISARLGDIGETADRVAAARRLAEASRATAWLSVANLMSLS